MLFVPKSFLNLLYEKEDENKKLKKELAELRVIADCKAHEDSDLQPCDKLECLACAYSYRYCDRDGGYVRRCTRNAKCVDFIPAKRAF